MQLLSYFCIQFINFSRKQNKMTYKIKILLFFAILNLAFVNITFDKKEFYDVFSGSSLEKINSMLLKLENEKSSSIKAAYKGALFMKKSSFLKPPARKIDLFNKGMLLLESEINKFPENVEYRFLRLSIQEHAPKILKYHKDIKKDKEMIIREYKNLDKEMKSIIMDYSKKSGILKPSDLKII